MITPQDDLFHERTDSPYWNESAWFQVPVPQADMNGWIYFYHRPNMNLSCGGATFYDPTGEDTYNCVYYHLDQHQALPKGCEVHDFSLDNGLTVETLDLLRAYRLSYKNEHCEIDVEWRAFMEPHEQRPPSAETMKLLRADGLPENHSKVNTPGVNPGQEGFANGHYDCAGHMQGTVTISGQRYEIDTPSLRDRSWGPRRAYVGLPRAGWGAAIASEEHSFQYQAIGVTPVEKDPIAGTTEHIVTGWYTRDGVQSELVSGHRRVVERGSDGRPLCVELECKDELGRDLRAVGRARTVLKCPWGAILFVWDSMVDWEFDGSTVPGEEMEYYLTTRRDRRFPQYNELS